MSLIIAMATRDGIIAAGDTRTTITKNCQSNYLDGTKKVHPVYGRAVILNCGNNSLTDELFVNSFIEEFIKNDIDPRKKIEIGYIAYSLLNKTLQINPQADITYLVIGYEEGKLYSYRVRTKTKECQWEFSSPKASYAGITDICHAILNGCDYKNMILKQGVRLCECALYATHASLTYRENKLQSVSSQYDIYIIDKYGHDTGWVTENHELYKNLMRKQISGTYPQNHILPGKEKLL